MFFWLRGEHALPKTRVACVSRLIGNSDSTGKATQWQVGHWGGTAFGNKLGVLGTLARWAVWCRREGGQMHETPLLREWHPKSPVKPFTGHWPPSELKSGGYFLRFDCRLPGWLFPFF